MLTSFPAETLHQPENFISLLYYLGLLTFAGERRGLPLLRIPNQTVRQLMYGYLRDAYREAGVFAPATWELADRLSRMAYSGDWEPFFDDLAERIREQASVRDDLQGEKMIQGFLLAWLNLTPFFRVWSEQEQGGGFVDLYLAPFYFWGRRICTRWCCCIAAGSWCGGRRWNWRTKRRIGEQGARIGGHHPLNTATWLWPPLPLRTSTRTPMRSTSVPTCEMTPT